MASAKQWLSYQPGESKCGRIMLLEHGQTCDGLSGIKSQQVIAGTENEEQFSSPP